MLVFVCLLLTSLVVTMAQPPPIPPAYASWVVRSLISTPDGQPGQMLWSYGEHINVDTTANGFCEYGRQVLYPVPPNPTYAVSMFNYTTGKESAHVVQSDGSAFNCTSRDVTGPMQPGGSPHYAPAPSLFSQLTANGYMSVNGDNCSVWTVSVTPSQGLLETVTWAVRVSDTMPALYVNKTYDAVSKTTNVITVAYNGQYAHVGFNDTCYGGCISSVCIANRGASDGTLGGAIAWACGSGGVNCAPVNEGGSNYYPNTLISHCDWVFGQYYQANSAQGPGACNFNGAARLVSCDMSCEKCQPKADATDQALLIALSFACGPQGLQNCSEIQPGGSNFLPNTTRNHADWAFDRYYQIFRCVPNMDACDFGGVAEIDGC